MHPFEVAGAGALFFAFGGFDIMAYVVYHTVKGRSLPAGFEPALLVANFLLWMFMFGILFWCVTSLRAMFRMKKAYWTESSVSTFIYKPAQPISTVRRHLIIIPELAEKEIGFNQIIFRLRNVTQNTGAATVFYGSEATLNALKKLLAKKSGEASYIEFNDWDDFLIVFRDIKPDDTMWIILSRKEGLSYAPAMARIPKYLNKYFQANSFVLAYPVQAGMNEGTRYLT